MNTSSTPGDTGIVYKKSTGSYWVDVDGQTVVCSISSRLRKLLIYPPRDRSSLGYLKVDAVLDAPIVDPVAIGDHVRFVDAGAGEGMIVEVLPRAAKLTRRAPGRKPLEQVVVANADQIVVVTAASYPVPDLVMLDRYLVSAEAAEVPALIVFTKWDEEAERRPYVEETIADYRRIGYPVISTSAVSGLGLTEFHEAVQGRLSVLVGMSGVGKSSLLNAIQPGLGLRVNDVSEHHGEGRHTTTQLQMFPLDSGGYIVDTPGMREFSLWDIPQDEIIELFPEAEDYIGGCKFNNCTHTNEPHCAVRRAVEEGHIAQQRYRSYLHIRQEG